MEEEAQRGADKEQGVSVEDEAVFGAVDDLSRRNSAVSVRL